MKQNDNSWQLRYVVQYAGSQATDYYRPIVRNFLESLAHLTKVQYVWIENHEQIYSLLGGENTLSDLYSQTDSFYLRALPLTTIDRKQFHQIVDAVFHNQQLGDPLQVCKIAQHLLKRLPWPS